MSKRKAGDKEKIKGGKRRWKEGRKEGRSVRTNRGKKEK